MEHGVMADYMVVEEVLETMTHQDLEVLVHKV
jgi:hypothetical protein